MIKDPTPSWRRCCISVLHMQLCEGWESPQGLKGGADRTIEPLRQTVHAEAPDPPERDVAGRKAEGWRIPSGTRKKRHMISHVLQWGRGEAFVSARCAVSGALCTSTSDQNAANSKLFAAYNLLGRGVGGGGDMTQFRFHWKKKKQTELQWKKDEGRVPAEECWWSVGLKVE